VLAVWIAFAVFAAVVLAGAGFVVARGLDTWRTFRRFLRQTSRALDEINRRVTWMEHKLASTGDAATRLQRAREELDDSLATAGVLSAALSEVRATVSRITGFVPSK
jgi:ABC-type transporter Mla subunit MlaD